jgi:M6 family metalloprotease-like protein
VLLISSLCRATVPNFPGYEKACNCTWESVHDLRKRLGIDYKYKTRLINPELCRTISEEQCEAIDNRMIDEGRRKREMIDKVKEQRLQNRNLQELASSVGVLKVLVVLVQWSDHGNKELIPRADLETLFMGDEVADAADLVPTGSVKRYFEVNSYNQLTVDATVTDWIMTDNTEQFYSQFGDRGRDPALVEALRLPLDTLNNQGFPFQSFDSDFSGHIDILVFMHSGYEGNLGIPDCNTNAPFTDRIAAHATAAPPSFSWAATDSTQVGAYAVMSAFRGACGANIARLGTLVHEMIHNLGVPDLYDRYVHLPYLYLFCRAWSPKPHPLAFMKNTTGWEHWTQALEPWEVSGIMI